MLTLDASRSRQRSCNDNDATLATIGDIWSREQRLDAVFRLRTLDGDAQLLDAAAGRIDVEQSVGIVGWKKASVLGQQRTLQMKDESGRRQFDSTGHRIVAANAQFVGDEGR
jgi:hypothetical protein